MRLGEAEVSLAFLADAPLAPEHLDARAWRWTDDGALRLDIETGAVEIDAALLTPPEPGPPAAREATGRHGLRPLATGPTPRVGNPAPRHLMTAPAASPTGARSMRVPVPAPEPQPSRVAHIALVRVAPPPPPPSSAPLFDLRARAPTPEAEARLEQRLRAPGHRVPAGAWLLLETHAAPLAAGRGRLVLDGDQDLRFIAADRDDRPLIDQVLPPGPHAVALPAGTRRVMLLGHGVPDPIVRPSVGAGLSWTCPLLRLGPRSFVVPGGVLSLRDVRTDGAIWEAETLTREATGLELHLPDQVLTVALVLARSGEFAVETRHAATVRARGAELAPRTMIERGPEQVWLFPVAPPAADRPRPAPMSIAVVPGEGWWARALIGRRESLPSLVTAIRTGTWSPLEEPRQSESGLSIARLERS